MRITKLHILLLVLLLGGLGFSGYYVWKSKQAEKVRQENLKVELAKQRQLEEEALRKAADSAAAENPASTSLSSDALAVSASAAAEKKPAGGTKYFVQRGDTLWSIAKQSEHFGAGHRWYDIWKANEGAVFDFDRIVAGQELVIPLDVPADFSWPETSAEKKSRLLGGADGVPADTVKKKIQPSATN